MLIVITFHSLRNQSFRKAIIWEHNEAKFIVSMMRDKYHWHQPGHRVVITTVWRTALKKCWFAFVWLTHQKCESSCFVCMRVCVLVCFFFSQKKLSKSVVFNFFGVIKSSLPAGMLINSGSRIQKSTTFLKWFKEWFCVCAPKHAHTCLCVV